MLFSLSSCNYFEIIVFGNCAGTMLTVSRQTGRALPGGLTGAPNLLAGKGKAASV